jgi:Ser/Thr protein kinase RdoA (MazF antagonist)
MASEAPPSWREDLQAAVPWVDPAKAIWLGNLNVDYPWRTVVGDIRLADGRRVVLKYQTDHYQTDTERERAAARFLEDATAPRIAPECLGADATRRVLVFERLSGSTLAEALDRKSARAAWLEAARMVASLHRWATDQTSRWLELCPQDGTADRLPAYALPLDALVAPFHRAGEFGAPLTAAIGVAQQAVAEPGPWLGFTHGDLQTRHILCTETGPRIVDWERAGLRHRLYDLACLIEKPIYHGRRLPRWAEEAAVAEYARVCALDPEEVRRELSLVLAYERLIGVAEEQTGDLGPVEARACLDGLLALANRDARLAPIGEAAMALLDLLPEESLPFCAGLDGHEDEASAPDPGEDHDLDDSSGPGTGEPVARSCNAARPGRE